jgi:pimeloyl-ACP methyl ester carboxylesterase
MVGVDPQYLGRYGHELSDLAGLIPVSGQMVTHFTVRSEQGLPSEHPVIDAAAPIYYIGAGIPPVLAIAGSQDMPARPEENRYFVASLKAAEHPDAEYREFEGRTHGTIVTQIPEAGDPVAMAMIGFISRLSGS